MVERREDFDWTRHAAFCAFGFAYLGGFQYWLYNVKFAQWCGPLTRTFGHRATAPIKTFIDQARGRGGSLSAVGMAPSEALLPAAACSRGSSLPCTSRPAGRGGCGVRRAARRLPPLAPHPRLRPRPTRRAASPPMIAPRCRPPPPPQALHHPFIYFPSFFAIKAVVGGQPLSSAADKYRAEIWDSLKALWMVWVPAQVRRARAARPAAGQRRRQRRAGPARWSARGRRQPPPPHTARAALPCPGASPARPPPPPPPRPSAAVCQLWLCAAPPAHPLRGRRVLRLDRDPVGARPRLLPGWLVLGAPARTGMPWAAWPPAAHVALRRARH